MNPYRVALLCLVFASHQVIPTSAGAGAPSPPDVWDSGTYEANPTATDPVGEGDDHLRALKNELRQRLEVEHKFGTPSGSVDNGLHYLGSARCFVQTSAPTVIEEAPYSNSGAATVATLSTVEPGGSDKTGLGRCWVDTDGNDGAAGTGDDGQLYYYDATLGWNIARTVNTNLGANNLTYNSKFAATTAGTITTAQAGWALTDATVAYAAPPDTEGQALEAQVTSSAANGRATQTFTGLKATAIYYVIARVDPDDTGGDTCSIVSTGGAGNISDTTSGTAIQTLTGTFTTDATPTAVVLRLESDNNGDRCDWASVAVYEIGLQTGVGDAGIVVATESASPAANAVAGTETISDGANVINPMLTVPAPGGVIIVEASTNVSAGPGPTVGTVALMADVNGGGAAACRTVEVLVSENEGDIVPIRCVIENPAGGATYVFTMAITESSGALFYGDPDGGDTDSAAYIDAVWYPAR